MDYLGKTLNLILMKLAAVDEGKVQPHLWNWENMLWFNHIDRKVKVLWHENRDSINKLLLEVERPVHPGIWDNVFKNQPEKFLGLGNEHEIAEAICKADLNLET